MNEPPQNSIVQLLQNISIPACIPSEHKTKKVMQYEKGTKKRRTVTIFRTMCACAPPTPIM